MSTSVDISSVLNDDGSLCGWLFVKASQEDSYMDMYERELRIIYGAVDYDINKDSTLSFGASYQELERNGVRWGGLPAFYTDGTRTNFYRDLTVTSNWMYWNVGSSLVR